MIRHAQLNRPIKNKGSIMRFRLVSSVIALAAFATFATSISPALAQGQLTAQQEKMKMCNADATSKGLKGDARKSFMSDCLKAKPAAAVNSQQAKMKACNAEASDKKLKGDPRRMFITKCLKGTP